LQFPIHRLPIAAGGDLTVTKKNYISHTVADDTATLKLIEIRFHLPALTVRDHAQMDMTEFFDFNAAPRMTPPTPPDRLTNGACYLDHLP
jgi:phospholipase C